MPLSNYEQRVLEAMERALYEQDPHFADRVALGRTGSLRRLQNALPIVGLVMGLALIFTFCLTAMLATGMAGCLVLLASLATLWSHASRSRLSNRFNPRRRAI